MIEDKPLDVDMDDFNDEAFDGEEDVFGDDDAFGNDDAFSNDDADAFNTEDSVEDIDAFGDEVKDTEIGDEDFVDEEETAALHFEMNEETIAEDGSTIEASDKDSKEEDADFSFDDAWQQSDDGLNVDMTKINEVQSFGDRECLAVASGNNLVYIAHGTAGEMEYMIKTLGLAIGSNLVRIQLLNEDIEELKDNPVKFRETFKRYVEEQ